jgi:hypothetical protein
MGRIHAISDQIDDGLEEDWDTADHGTDEWFMEVSLTQAN